MSILDNLFIKVFNKHVGTDQFGNKYFISKKKNYLGKCKRFVIYNGKEISSKIPPNWHGWVHYLTDEIPGDDNLLYSWQKEHMPNVTGTIYAKDSAKNPVSKKTYSSWNPN